ncbi:MAG: HNH endonuclease signature motif containing protein [Dehalococcoidales bacterium]|nr:HNH endonuclease signature motif containing protein [Dehalococcoidales bacterium]
MANRFQIRQHEIAYKFIAARDGDFCLQCKKKPPAVKLQIDHADNDPDNWDPENLHLLCQKHNLELRGKTAAEHKRLIRTYSANNERERARERGRENTHLVKDLVDFRNASPEMKANSYYETQYREWLLTIVREHGFITKVEAINSGAEVVGCSPLTANRYLSKLTSSVGPLKESKDATGTVVISFR